MEVDIKVISTLERQLTVKIPNENLQQKFDEKIKELTPKIRLAGFRQGKVPPRIVRQRFGQSIRGEVVEDILRETFPKALEQQALQPAGMPQVEIIHAEEGMPLEYVATFEILPIVTLNPIAELKVEKITAEITDEDVQRMLTKLQQQHVKWREVQRAAQTGDQVIMDFIGTVAGKEFPGNKATNFPLELGASTMIPGFEEGLLGIQAGEERVIKLTFPSDYHAADLADKEAEFTVKATKISEPELPALDDQLAKTLGIDSGLEGLKAEIRKTIQRELTQSVRFKNREHVFAEILKHNQVELPKVLVTNELDRIVAQTKEMLQQGTGESHTDTSEYREKFQKLAKRRVALSLLLAEFIKQYNIEIDKELVKQLVEEIAGSYHQPQQVIEWYYRNKEQMAQIESSAIEQQIVDKIYSEAAVTEKHLAYEEAIKPIEEKED